MLDRSIDSGEKAELLSLVAQLGIEEKRLTWKKRRYGLIMLSMLVYFPSRYYIVFEKKGNYLGVKEFFPNWGGETRTAGSAKGYRQLISDWVASIKRTQDRQKAIVVSLEEGAERRRRIWRVAKKL